MAGRKDVVICDLMLVEVFLKLRNAKNGKFDKWH